MNRKERILNIRPVVDVQVSDGMEAFQNSTLRPILKFQHALTQVLLHESKRYTKMLKGEMPKEVYHQKVTEILRSDQSMRQLITGVVIGMMTVEEYRTYAASPKEYNKRIITMQAKRYADTAYQDIV